MSKKSKKIVAFIINWTIKSQTDKNFKIINQKQINFFYSPIPHTKMQDQYSDYEAPGFDIETNLNFLDEIEQYDNPDSCDKSVANSSTKSASSRSENKDSNSPSDGKMVMIDKNQLQELLQAKLILESQKIANASAQLQSTQKDTSDLIGAAFSNGLFNPYGNFQNEKPSAPQVD